MKSIVLSLLTLLTLNAYASEDCSQYGLSRPSNEPGMINGCARTEYVECLVRQKNAQFSLGYEDIGTRDAGSLISVHSGAKWCSDILLSNDGYALLQKKEESGECKLSFLERDATCEVSKNEFLKSLRSLDCFICN